MASRIIELANLVSATIDRILTADCICAEADPPDKVFTELYREFASGPIEFDDIKSVIEAIRDIRDAVTGFSGVLSASEDLEIMRSAWSRLRPRLLAYAAYTDGAARDPAGGGPAPMTPGRIRAFPPPAAVSPGICGMTFEDKGRVVTVDGQPYHGFDLMVFRVIEFMKRSEPLPVTRQVLIDNKLIDRDTTGADLDDRIPPDFPVRIKGGRLGLQLVYRPASPYAGDLNDAR